MTYSDTNMNIPSNYDAEEEFDPDALPYLEDEFTDESQEDTLDELDEYADDELDPDEEEDFDPDALPYVNDELMDESQEDMLDEFGEYSDDELDPEEVLYGEESTDFDYAYYDNADEWEGIKGQDDV